MKLRAFIPLAAFAAVAAMLRAGVVTEPRVVPSPLVGRPAPAFTLPRLSAAEAPLASRELLGRVWVLNVWASWCAPCRDEHPLLVQAARDGGVYLVGLVYKDDPRAAEEWLLRLGDPYAATVLDTEGRVGIDFGVVGVPETFVIDRDGVVRWRHTGPLTAEVWGRQVLPLVRGLQG
ncbi:MAG: DsbE family thiol:disulfide interchange protein [Rubrivivax sp.]|nr:DsbE family thiol:disulfide interchange protein [Rubrivivax sp.]